MFHLSPPRESPLVPVLLALAKPLLHVHLRIYRRDLLSAAFPSDEPVLEIEGTDPDHLVFIGSIAISGYGVLRHGMKTSSRTAQRVATARGRGLQWSELTHPVMTAREATALPLETTAGADQVVILLGITDVLLGTDPAAWSSDLVTLVRRIRENSGPDCGIVLVGIPPMAEFRPIPPLARRLLTRQINRLNRATDVLARTIGRATYVPFPTWDVGDLFIEDVLSWDTMHAQWAKAISPAVVDRLDQQDADRDAASTSTNVPAPMGPDMAEGPRIIQGPPVESTVVA